MRPAAALAAAAVAALLGCRDRSGPAAAVSPPEPAAPRPAPGADLAGPIAPPTRIAAHPERGATTVDLGIDRAAVAIELPTPPRGGAAAFTFGDDRRGWVTRIPETNQLPSVAYGDGRIFVSGGFESISFYALDAHDGHVAWAAQQLEDNGPTAPIYEDGRVVFNTESCTLFVMDAATGTKLWSKYLGDPTLAQPAVADGLIYASHPCPTGQCLSAYRLRTGAVAWSRAIAAELLAAPVVAGDAVYATALGGRVYRFDRTTGRRVWSKPLRATTAPWIDGDRLYVARRGRRVEQQIVVATADGAVLAEHASVAARYLGDVPTNLDRWKQVWAFEGSRPAVLDGVKYEAMAGFVQASDPTTGAVLWRRRWAAAADRRSLGTVAVAGTQLVVSTRGGELFGLDLDTGYTVWAYALGTPIAAQPIIAHGWVYAATVDGAVVALDVGDASLDGWHMWGGNPRHNGPVAATPSVPL
ncbi:MAG: PQQ-binding-like beta-propeller repeat protein [Myxococcales bacterium]|nr:PQQ-binding-like beta-propeller repeat protein [Myxococcales bacterium]